MTQIHALILAKDESRHLERCLKSLNGQVDSVTVVDSGSSDNTVEIATALGARVLMNPWVNYATQMNFGIAALASEGGWLFRIDADEVFDSASVGTLASAVRSAVDDVDGIVVQRRIHFLGKRIRYGGIEPSWQLRLWRNGRGSCEQRWMDEHIKVRGRVIPSSIIVSDINLNSLTWWTAKHNSYASREAIDILGARHGFSEIEISHSYRANSQARFRRLLKERVFTRLPGGVRSVMYFFYRYFVRLGFLDGAEGFYFHSLQALWYRILVDAKVAEIEDHAKRLNIDIRRAIRDKTGLAV